MKRLLMLGVLLFSISCYAETDYEVIHARTSFSFSLDRSQYMKVELVGFDVETRQYFEAKTINENLIGNFYVIERNDVEDYISSLGTSANSNNLLVGIKFNLIEKTWGWDNLIGQSEIRYFLAPMSRFNVTGMVDGKSVEIKNNSSEMIKRLTYKGYSMVGKVEFESKP